MSVKNNKQVQKAKKIFYSFVDILKSPEMNILPGQLAFYFMMSIVPITAISAIIASLITKNYSFADTVSSVMPSVFARVIITLANDMQFYDALLILILYILFGSNAARAISIASNVLYDMPQPSYLRSKAKSVLMTLLIVFLLLFVILIPLLGDSIVKFLMLFINDPSFFEKYVWLYVALKVLISFVVMYFVIKFLYTHAPSEKIDNYTTIRGTIFTTLSWIFATNIFSYYVTKIASYDILYGNFANILVLMLWIYLLAFLFVVGMALNVEDFHKKRDVVNSEKKGEEK